MTARRGTWVGDGPDAPEERTAGVPAAPAPAAPAWTGAFEEAAHGGRGWGLKPADVAFAVATVLAALGIWAALGFAVPWGASDAGPAGDVDGASGAQSTGLVVVVQNTDGFYQVLSLDEDAEVTVESAQGTNVVEVSGGRVRVARADCSNQVCVDTGWVSEEGQTIVCLPHELTVQVVADEDDAVPLM